jgi:hypothetical protein
MRDHESNQDAVQDGGYEAPAVEEIVEITGLLFGSGSDIQPPP